MTTVYAGASSGFVPNFQASGNLQVEFTRNPAKFALPQYAKFVTTPKNVGLYLRIDTSEAIAAVADGDYIWPDGNDAPIGKSAAFEWLPFATKRRAFSFRLGELAYQQADFDMVMANARIKAQLAMNTRTKLAADVLRTSGNYTSGNFDTAANIGGGVWAGSSAANAYIEKTFRAARDKIVKASGGAVGFDDLVCVLDPVGVATIVQSPEYKTYILNHPQALDAARSTGVFAAWGILDKLWGFNIVVEHTPIRTTREGEATQTVNYLFSGGTTVKGHAFFLARQGDLREVAGAQDISSLTVFLKEDMTVETKDDRDNRRMDGRVVDDQVAILTAPIAAVGVTNIDAAAD